MARWSLCGASGRGSATPTMQDPDVDTIDSMVMPQPLGWEPIARPPRRRWIAPFALVVVAVVLTIVAFVVELPYIEVAPGSATPVGGLIRVPPDRAHPPKGQVLFTTVTLAETRIVDAIAAWIDPDSELVKKEAFFPPNVNNDQFRQLNLELMESSEQTAIVVALRRLGYDISEEGKGALITALAPDAPAAGHLRQGDVVTAVDGQTVALAAELSGAIRAHAPGDVVRLEVQSPEGGRRFEEVRLGTRPGDSVAFLGVELLTKDRMFTKPFDVDIETGRVGGPSAGLAFTLAVIDSLTEGELTGGRKVAVTGTIEIDGSVGEVGGVAQKTAAVRDAGAQVFLVPPGEFEVARERAGDGLEVVSVANLEEALAALGRAGGNVQALGRAGAGTPR